MEIGQKIKDKQIQFADLAIENAKASMVNSFGNNNKNSNQGDYMVDGKAH